MWTFSYIADDSDFIYQPEPPNIFSFANAIVELLVREKAWEKVWGKGMGKRCEEKVWEKGTFEGWTETYEGLPTGGIVTPNLSTPAPLPDIDVCHSDASLRYVQLQSMYPWYSNITRRRHEILLREKIDPDFEKATEYFYAMLGYLDALKTIQYEIRWVPECQENHSSMRSGEYLHALNIIQYEIRSRGAKFHYHATGMPVFFHYRW